MKENTTPKNKYKSSILNVLLLIYIFLPIGIMTNNIEYTNISIFILILLGFITRYFYILLILLTLIFNTVGIHLILHWGNLIDVSSRIQAIFLSTKNESKEYILNYFSVNEIYLGLYLFIGVYLIYIIQKKGYYKISVKIKVIASFILIFSMLLIPLNILEETTPFKYLKGIYEINNISNLVNERSEFLKKIDKSEIKKELSNNKIIIILGESENKEFMGIYNAKYKRTTPFFNKLYKEGKLDKYRAISPSNQTRLSIPMMLTESIVKDFYLFKKSESIISIIKRYGYKTSWFSNQFKVGRHDTYINSMIQESDEYKIANYIYDKGGQGDLNNDKILLDFMDNRVENRKELIVLHLLGSHFSYDKRYPSNYKLIKNEETIKDKYLNTIYYTDYIIEQIYNKNKDALIIYVSDHGEVMHKGFYGHGFSQGYKEEYTVPFVVINSINKLDKNIIYNLEDLNKIILNLIGVNKKNDFSESKKLLVLSPNNIKDFEGLNDFK